MTNTQETHTDGKEGLKACPFCGDAASFEWIGLEADQGCWSVGCGDEACIGWQSMARFARKCEAIAAWNRRAPLLRHAEGVGWRPIETHDGYSFPCLVCRRECDGPYYEPKCAFIDANGNWRIAGGSGSTPLHFKPTFWMPLPNPPQEGRGNNE